MAANDPADAPSSGPPHGRVRVAPTIIRWVGIPLIVIAGTTYYYEGIVLPKRQALGSMTPDRTEIGGRPEARAVLERIVTAAQNEYATHGHICSTSPGAGQMVPKDLAAIRGKAYVSTPDEWLTGTEANEGFACLHFSVTGPQRWSYRYMGGPGPDGVQAFQAFAYSDLLGRGPGYADYVTVMGRVENGKLKVHWFFPPPPYE